MNKDQLVAVAKAMVARGKGLLAADESSGTIKRRFDVIDQLKSRQDGPVKLLGMIGNTVNSTDAVWLQSMTDEGATIQLQGVALSQVAVASLMTNLKQSGYFKSVEIKETAQEDVVKNMQAFSFTLICEKQKV